MFASTLTHLGLKGETLRVHPATDRCDLCPPPNQMPALADTGTQTGRIECQICSHWFDYGDVCPRCKNNPEQADTGTLTDEAIYTERDRRYGETHPDGAYQFEQGARWARDFRAPMPTREQIEALKVDPHAPSTDPQKFQAMFEHGRTQWNGAIDTVLALFGKSEAAS